MLSALGSKVWYQQGMPRDPHSRSVFDEPGCLTAAFLFPSDVPNPQLTSSLQNAGVMALVVTGIAATVAGPAAFLVSTQIETRSPKPKTQTQN